MSINRNLKIVLTKLLIALSVLVVLTIFCRFVNHDFVGIIGAIIVLIVFPTVLLLSIDASRIIRCEVSGSHLFNALGLILGFPQLVLGLALISIGAVYLFEDFQLFTTSALSGREILTHGVYAILAFMMIVVGYYYMREYFGLLKDKKRDT